MSAYEPPTEIDPIFNSLAFQTPNEATLTIAEGDERYLARQNIATSVASATSFTGEVSATSFKSLDSGATIFHIENLAGNNAAMTIRNQRTDHSLFYRQFGTTNSHIFTTNGTATTNLTLSNTVNTSSLPLLVTFPSAGNPVRTIEIVDGTSANRLAIIPSTTGGHLGNFNQAGDTQFVSLGGGGVNTGAISINTYSNTVAGVRITATQVHIGAGGNAFLAPTSAILFNSSAGNATVTGNLQFPSANPYLQSTNTSSDLGIQGGSGRGINFFTNGGASNPFYLKSSGVATFNGDIELRTTQPTNTAGYLGYTVKQNGTNTAAITTGVAYNNNSTGLSITPGVYIFHFLLYNSKLAAGAGDINEIQVGISTNSTNFVGGDTTIIKGFQTYVSTASAQVVMGNASLTFSVPTTATYYFLQQASHTIGATNLVGTTTSYWEYTRVA